MRTLVTLFLLSASFAFGQDGIQWLGDYQEALKQAKATGKPILVEFRCEA